MVCESTIDALTSFMTALKDIEFRAVIRGMEEEESEAFIQDLKEEITDHLLAAEEAVLVCYATDKVSYESRQLLKELGVD